MANLRNKDKPEIGRSLADGDLLFVTKTAENTDNNSTFLRIKNQVTDYISGITESLYTRATTISSQLDTKANLSGSTFTGSVGVPTLSATTIFSGSTNIGNMFLLQSAEDVTRVRAGSNILTGGTGTVPIINIVASPFFNDLTISGNTSLQALSATTVISGVTDIGNMFLLQSAEDITRVYDGRNTTIGGTPNNPIVNVVSSPVFNNLTASGNTSLATVSATTIISGTTDLNNLFATQTTTNTINNQLNTKANLSGATFTGNVNVGVLSATTFSATTMISGRTNLSNIFLQTVNEDKTRIHAGSNISTGGTANDPIINIVASPFFNQLTTSGTTTVNSTLTVTGTTNLSSFTGEQINDVCYLTYAGTSGTTTGTKGCTLTSPGNWTVTKFSTAYYCDDAGGNLIITIPDASASNEGKTMTFVKPRIVQSKNNAIIQTTSRQLVQQSPYQKLQTSNDRIELISVPFSSNGSLTYKYRSTNSTLLVSDVIDVALDNSQVFSAITDAVTYCNLYADNNIDIRFAPGNYYISDTITINCPYNLSIRAHSPEVTSFIATYSLSGKPMFSAVTACDFKQIAFSGYTGYGAVENECCIEFSTPGIYAEVQNCVFNGFYNAVEIENNSEMWVFNSIINNSSSAAIMCMGGSFGTSEMTFSNNKNAVFISGCTGQRFSVQNSIFQINSGQTGINYFSGKVLNSEYDFITNNAFYGIGTYLSGHQWTQKVDSDVRIENNAGLSDFKPLHYMWVTGSTSAVTCTNQNQYYKATFTEANIANSEYIKFSGNTVNKTTYLPKVSRRMKIFLSGDLSCGSAGKTISISIFKNGNIKLQDIDIICTTQNVPYSFSIIGENTVNENDFFEIFVANLTDGNRAVTVRTLMFLITS